MKRLSILTVALVIITIACNKDKFTTTPQLKLKSISPSSLNSGDVLRVEGSYTDQEGDLDSVFYVYKWYNGNTEILALDTQRLTFESLKVPPKTKEADILLTFEYQTNNLGLPILSGVSRDTTATFGLILKDKAGNRSEYKQSEKIRIIKP
jgi:hypothetical protein